jgi:SAM-dependent methyltransferase
MGAKRHKRTRDVPHHVGEGRGRKFIEGDQVHSHRKRTAAEYGARDPQTKEWLGVQDVRKKIGTGCGTRGRPADAAPSRPPFCMLFDDLAQDEPPTGVFGMYPSALIPKLMPWLRCERREVLHVCSGGLPRGEGIRVDLRPEARPDIIADGRALPLADASVAAVLLDPPYSEHYARELYGTAYPRPAHLLAEAARVVRPGGRIGFVHYIVPNPPEGCHHVKTFGLSMGFGYPMRAVTLFEREQASLLEGIA